ncbi:MAG TPA: cupin domain-containing protein [Chloroflexia bacterium]
MTAEGKPDAGYVIPMERLEAFYDEPGEYGWIMEGHKHGFGLTSVIVTQTAPLGGPPLHTHHSEEVHVLPECRLAYVIGDSTFEAVGPCVVNIPAGVPHTFLNIGPEPVSLVCFFPANSFWDNYDELGPNPLLERYSVGAQPG